MSFISTALHRSIPGSHPAQSVGLQRLHWRIADFILGLMLVGPLIMPFFLQSGWLPMIAVGRLIYGIGQAICPQLPYSPVYGGIAFAVCYRCAAALIGLIIARGLHREGGAMRLLAWQVRILWLAICVVWLTVEVQGTARGWWPGVIPVMLAHGVIYGMGVGGIIYGGLLALDRALERLTPARAAL
ncbi:MAG: hypothetical protein ACYDBJ_26720 [Aggregatilineales bacterium]